MAVFRGLSRHCGGRRPAHHLGDPPGLVSGFATIGYAQFLTTPLAGMALSGPAAADRLHAMGRGYVLFAREHPNLFRLMFRGKRLDTRRPALQAAMKDAFNALADAASASAGAAPCDGAGSAVLPDRFADITAA